MVLTSLVLLITCQKEEIEKVNYPRVLTHDVQDITTEGVRFSGELVFRGNSEILDYGFIWGEVEDLRIERINRDYVYSLGNNCKGQFSKEISFSLKENADYYVKSYVKTNDYISYGNPITFTSLGSKAPEITNFYPKSATWGDTITLNGKNFNIKIDGNKVWFDDIESRIVYASGDTLLSCVVPLNLGSHKSKIKLASNENKSSTTNGFTLNPPIIDNISNVKVVVGDTVSIYGQNFSPTLLNTIVKVGIYESQLVSGTERSITFIVPYETEISDNSINVEICSQEVQFGEKIDLCEPVIDRISPNIGCRGLDVSIIGENFSPRSDFNKVYIGNHGVSVINSSKDTIIINIEKFVEEGMKDVKVEIGRQSITKAGSYTHKEPWKQLQNIPNRGRRGAIYFSIGNKIYIGGGTYHIAGYNHDFLEYDIEKHSWTQKSDLPMSYNTSGLGFSNDSYGFCLIGTKLWQYDQDNDEWVEKSEYPEDGGYKRSAFVINDRIFICCEPEINWNKNLRFWEYIETTDSWERRADVPTTGSGFFGFSANSRGFVGTSEYKDFWEYDIDNDSWIKKANFIGEYSNNTSISAKNSGYVMTGWLISEQSFSNKMFRYDPTVDKWTEILNIPIEARSRSVGIEVNNKLYLGAGFSNINYVSTFYNDFYEYDPAKDFANPIPVKN